MELARSINEKLFLALNGNHSEWMDILMSVASNMLLYIPLLLLIVIFAFRYFRKQNSYHTLPNTILVAFILILEFVLCLELLPEFFASVFEMERPCLNPNISSMVRLVGEDCNAGAPFFAVRPFLMFFITGFLFFTFRKEFPGIKWMLVICSVLVAYSRIYLGAQYPLNVLIAAAVGVAVGFLGSRFYFYLKNQLFAI